MAKLKNLLIYPKDFFLESKNNYKKATISFLIFSFLIFFFWFLKILLQVNNIPVSSNLDQFNQLFGSFGLSFTAYFFIFLLADILLILTFSLIITILTKLVALILKINITLKNIWIISVYSLIAFVFALLYQLLVYLLNIPSLKVIGHLFYVYYLLLLATGIRAIMKNKVKVT